MSNIGWDLRPVFRAHGLDAFVDAYVLSYEHGIQKPDGRLFRAACEADRAGSPRRADGRRRPAGGRRRCGSRLHRAFRGPSAGGGTPGPGCGRSSAWPGWVRCRPRDRWPDPEATRHVVEHQVLGYLTHRRPSCLGDPPRRPRQTAAPSGRPSAACDQDAPSILADSQSTQEIIACPRGARRSMKNSVGVPGSDYCRPRWSWWTSAGTTRRRWPTSPTGPVPLAGSSRTTSRASGSCCSRPFTG